MTSIAYFAIALAVALSAGAVFVALWASWIAHEARDIARGVDREGSDALEDAFRKRGLVG